mmetsp:Transcript_17179/g.56135  ORF Transcript_17179/g.56135 Transcript_17179/m.56135 type:complete len:242 (+) Transcript_17179:1579-2304(+)|eukprot:scaffold7681_cov135-Isochrysis_galbana.AAC.3
MSRTLGGVLRRCCRDTRPRAWRRLRCVGRGIWMRHSVVRALGRGESCAGMDRVRAAGLVGDCVRGTALAHAVASREMRSCIQFGRRSGAKLAVGLLWTHRVLISAAADSTRALGAPLVPTRSATALMHRALSGRSCEAARCVHPHCCIFVVLIVVCVRVGGRRRCLAPVVWCFYCRTVSPCLLLCPLILGAAGASRSCTSILTTETGLARALAQGLELGGWGSRGREGACRVSRVFLDVLD